MIPLGAYLPDQPALGQHATVANNCVPAVGYYAPFYSPVRYTNAAAEQALGAFGTYSTSGIPYNFAGTDSYLYKVSASAWEDVSKVGGYNSGSNKWDFAVFGNRVIATNGVDKPQSYVMGTSTDFADLTADDVIARTVAIVRGFVFLGYMTETAVEYRNRVRWSALEDPTDFTSSTTTQSDYQDLYGETDAGSVVKIVGGEYATIFCERGIFRGTYVGGDLIFTFDQIVNDLGTRAPGSVVSHGDMIFFVGRDGFYMLTPAGLVPIGEGSVNRMFMNELYSDDIGMISATVDPNRSLYIVAYPVSAGTLGKILIYNWTTKQWTTAEPGNMDCLFRFLSEATATDSATAFDDPDTGDYANVPTDSPVWFGGTPSFAGVDSSHYAVTFNGAPLTASFETGEGQLNGKGKALVTNIIPMVEGNPTTIYASVGYRNTPNESVTYTDEVAVNSEGECNLFNTARYQRAKLRVVGGFTKAYGVNFEATQAGRY